jgi:hypothetical protein
MSVKLGSSICGQNRALLLRTNICGQYPNPEEVNDKMDGTQTKEIFNVKSSPNLSGENKIKKGYTDRETTVG